MRRLALLLPLAVVLTACGGGTTSTAASTTSPTSSPSPSPSASPTPTQYEQFVALATSRGVTKLSTKESEAQSVAANLCDNSDADFDTLLTALHALPDFEDRYKEEAAFMDVYCPTAEANLTQAKLRVDQHQAVPADFKIGIKVLKQSCFGSAGCNVTYRIDPQYVGPGTLNGSYEVTYQVTGGEDGPQINTFTIEGTTATYDQQEVASTKTTKPVLVATVTSVSKK